MFTAEGTWQWASGDPWGFESWHEGEPNNVDNEDCLSMSGQDGYNWMDLQCGTRWIIIFLIIIISSNISTKYHRDHMGTAHYAVCENRKG